MPLATAVATTAISSSPASADIAASAGFRRHQRGRVRARMRGGPGSAGPPGSAADRPPTPRCLVPFAGSAARHFKTIVSRSRGIAGSISGAARVPATGRPSGPDCDRALKRRPQRQQLVQRQAQPVDVAAGVRLAPQLFGRHVPQSPDDPAGLAFARRIDGPGQAKVRHADHPVPVDQQIARLDIAVQRALFMGVLQSLGRLNTDCATQRQPSSRKPRGPSSGGPQDSAASCRRAAAAGRSRRLGELAGESPRTAARFHGRRGHGLRRMGGGGIAGSRIARMTSSRPTPRTNGMT